MITHLVLMKLTDTADAPAIAQQVLELSGKIPGLRAVTGGESVVQLGTTWDLGFVMTLDDVDAVHTYQTHPAHVALGGNIRPFIAELATCDLADVTI